MPKKHKKLDITKPQQRLIGQIYETTNPDDLKVIASQIDELSELVSKGDLSKLEELLTGHILALNQLQSHYMSRSMVFAEPHLIKTFPNASSDLGNISIKLQIEMRKAIALLADLKNPKKPSQFIKSYVDKQVNSLQVTNDAQNMDRGTEGETATINPAVETVVSIDRSENGCREAQSISQ